MDRLWGTKKHPQPGRGECNAESAGKVSREVGLGTPVLENAMIRMWERKRDRDDRDGGQVEWEAWGQATVYSVVTDLAKFLGKSTSTPFMIARSRVWSVNSPRPV